MVEWTEIFALKELRDPFVDTRAAGFPEPIESNLEFDERF